MVCLIFEEKLRSSAIRTYINIFHPSPPFRISGSFLSLHNLFTVARYFQVKESFILRCHESHIMILNVIFTPT